MFFLNLKFLKHYKFLLSLFFIISANTAASETAELSDYKIGEQYKSVISRIDFSDPNDCRTKLSSPFFPIAIQNPSSIDYRDRFVRDPNNEKVLKLIRAIADQNCIIKRSEFMDFCLSTGELVHQSITFPITNKEGVQSSYSMFDKENSNFIGFHEDDELLDYDFERYLVGFTVFNPQKGILRSSSFTYFDQKNLKVTHELYKTSRGKTARGSVELCPDGPDTISSFKPRFTGLDKVIDTAVTFYSVYTLKKTQYNNCVATFPENQKQYENFYNRFRELNEGEFDLVNSKAEQVLIANKDQELISKYSKQIDRRKKLNNLFSSNLSAEQCNNILQNPEKITDTHVRSNDFEFIRDISLQ